ncbi:unnamed protein product [Ceutorhynchus assimilis]|uniref:Uncharacterized protein n=1 Tax=Ceutorhynchus assimilis TaxID=467358 RepID=A0A9N9MKE5_9CUCU|nr:unnamed protein product [Ceutorhynchus assimilis]
MNMCGYRLALLNELLERRHSAAVQSCNAVDAPCITKEVVTIFPVKTNRGTEVVYRGRRSIENDYVIENDFVNVNGFRETKSTGSEAVVDLFKGKGVPTSRNGKNKCELTDPPIVLSSKEDREDTGYLNENPETHQIDNRLKQSTNYTEIENSNEFRQFATGGNAQFSNCGHLSKGPHVVKLRENLEIPAFHGCDFNVPVNTRVPAGIKVCEPLNHTDVGILTACSVIEIPENSTKENRNIVVRILNTSPIPQTIYKNTPILNLVDVTRLKECSTADALCGADGTDYVSEKFSEIHTSCYEGHIVENMVSHLKGGDKNCESESEEEIVTDESEENVDRTDRMSSVLENENTERDGVDDDNQIIDDHENDSMRSLDADREENDDVAQVSINIRNPEPLEQQIRPQRIRQLPKRFEDYVLDSLD